MTKSTKIPNKDRNNVAPSANENAAPEFLIKVNWKKDPNTLMFGRCESV
jgi:hypothetical protein